jgi:hypothetical protein
VIGKGFPVNTVAPSAAETKGHTPLCRVALVGPAGRREFRELISWLCEHEDIRVSDEFSDIETALQHPDRLAESQLTVVLQSYSDQYAAPAIDQLIGQTLFQRLLCCYGAWCESDGRNRTQWPDALRVPVRLAQSVIELELPGIGAEADPIPPTAARDEIFAHRLIDVPAGTRLRELNAVIIGPDRVIRRTVNATLKELGMRTISLPLIVVNPRTAIRPQETPRGPIHMVLHDLDPYGSAISESLQAARQMFPSAKIFGLATMPDSGLTAEIDDEHLDDVVPKLDLQHGLQWKLTQHFS